MEYNERCLLKQLLSIPSNDREKYMEDILKSVKSFLYDRSVSPLFGALIVSWAFWNYRVILIILSNSNYIEKFNSIDQYFHPVIIRVFDMELSIPGIVIHGLIMPPILASLYLFVYPFVAEPVYNFSLKRQRKLREIKQNNDDERLLSISESRELTKQIAQISEKYDNDTEKLGAQISTLTKVINDLELKLATADSGITVNEGSEFSQDKQSENDFDIIIDNAVKNLATDEFIINDLFPQSVWNKLSNVDKQNIGRRFKQRLSSGEFPNIEISEKKKGNQLIYTKNNSTNSHKSSRLGEKEEAVLALHSGLDPDQGITATAAAKHLNLHIDEARFIVSELNDLKLIEYAFTAQNEVAYKLSKDGQKYLIKNQLLESKNA